jgi:hypothetical protein
MKNIFILLTFVLAVLITGCGNNQSSSENLIQNGNAELPKHDSTPGGWVNVKGNWRSVEGDSTAHNYAYAQNGKYHFFEGQDLLGILQQDINLDKYANGIDTHKQQFIFSGYVRSFPQDPPDQATITITGLDDSKNKSLYTFSSDTISSVSNWQQVTDTFIAPVSTRFIRVQLIATRRNGADNDGYFDNVILTTQTTGSAFDKKWLFIIIAIVLLVGVISVFIYRRNRTKNRDVTNITNIKS